MLFGTFIGELFLGLILLAGIVVYLLKQVLGVVLADPEAKQATGNLLKQAADKWLK